MNYSMGYPEPTVGETIWMRCPYAADLCGADATMTVTSIADEYVEGLVVCANQHRWKMSKLQDERETP